MTTEDLEGLREGRFEKEEMPGERSDETKSIMTAKQKLEAELLCMCEGAKVDRLDSRALKAWLRIWT